MSRRKSTSNDVSLTDISRKMDADEASTVHPNYDPDMVRRVLQASDRQILAMHRLSRQRLGFGLRTSASLEGPYKMF